MMGIKTISDMEINDNLPSSGFCVFLEINRLFRFWNMKVTISSLAERFF